MKVKKKKEPGVNVTVSKEAHEAMWREAIKAKPRRTLREQVNIMNNLPAEK